MKTIFNPYFCDVYADLLLSSDQADEGISLSTFLQVFIKLYVL